jgi:hypothetical protein
MVCIKKYGNSNYHLSYSNYQAIFQVLSFSYHYQQKSSNSYQLNNEEREVSES